MTTETTPITKSIYCCACDKDVDARLTDGEEIYNHRKDLKGLPFWKCDACKNYVGCHHKTPDRTRPLGNIPTKELRSERQRIHKILDPIWKEGKMERKQVYGLISKKLEYPFHTSEIKTVEEARKIYAIVQEIAA